MRYMFSGAMLFVWLTGPVLATSGVGLNGVANVPNPVPSSTAAPYHGPHLIWTPIGSLSLPGPLGCSTTGTASFLGGGFYNHPGGYAAGILDGESNNACDTVSIVGAGSYNVIGGRDGDLSYNSAIVGGLQSGIVSSAGAIIGGGWLNLISNAPSSPYYNANLSAIVAGNSNVITAPDSFIGAGNNNAIAPPSFSVAETPDDFIGSGYGNAITADFSVIGGGYHNGVTGEYATIGGGNANRSGAAFSFIGSGQSNVISSNAAIGGSAGAADAVIAGGEGNTITALVASGAKYGAILGGSSNTLSAFSGVISGGGFNIARGDYATVPGGRGNSALGANSFAAGTGSQALHSGTFLWSDNAPAATALKSGGTNEFLVRSSGGVAFFTSATLKSGVELFPGSGTWASLSDRAAKSDIVALDPDAVLEKVTSLPIDEWSYRTESARIRHIGPMAQDFYAAFGVGEDKQHITSIDEDGVALAAIKSLGNKNRTLEAQVRLLAANDASLAARDTQLEREVTRLLSRVR